jgi:hypothetical protein
MLEIEYLVFAAVDKISVGEEVGRPTGRVEI